MKIRLRRVIRHLIRPPTVLAATLAVLACLAGCADPGSAESESVPTVAGADGAFEHGPNNGRMLRDGKFAIELAIFEAGVVPPEFRAWATQGGRPLDPRAVELRVRLTRLGNRVDEHLFHPAGAFLRGTPMVDEPHSFRVSVTATRGGSTHRWEYDSFEGRTRIDAKMATAFGLRTAVAGPATIDEVVTVYGRIVADPGRVLEVSARFDGAIRAVHAKPGDRVREGEVLAIIESNESLKAYAVDAPISGVVTDRNANAGEQTSGRRLFTIVDASSVWAELAVFPGNRQRIAVGTAVTLKPTAGGASVDGTISYIDLFSAPDQSVSARAVLDNRAGTLAPGDLCNRRSEGRPSRGATGGPARCVARLRRSSRGLCAGRRHLRGPQGGTGPGGGRLGGSARRSGTRVRLRRREQLPHQGGYRERRCSPPSLSAWTHWFQRLAGAACAGNDTRNAAGDRAIADCIRSLKQRSGARCGRGSWMRGASEHA